MKNLTERQKEAYQFISDYIQQNKQSPTMREIAGHFKITNFGAYDHVSALRRKGFVETEFGNRRTIKILLNADGTPLKNKGIKRVPFFKFKMMDDKLFLIQKET